MQCISPLSDDNNNKVNHGTLVLEGYAALIFPR